MPDKRRTEVKEANLAAIGREWDVWMKKQGKPLTGASGTDGFQFFSYLQKEYPNMPRFLQGTDEQWQAVQTYLKHTGRVAD